MVCKSKSDLSKKARLVSTSGFTFCNWRRFFGKGRKIKSQTIINEKVLIMVLYHQVLIDFSLFMSRASKLTDLPYFVGDMTSKEASQLLKYRAAGNSRNLVAIPIKTDLSKGTFLLRHNNDGLRLTIKHRVGNVCSHVVVSSLNQRNLFKMSTLFAFRLVRETRSMWLKTWLTLLWPGSLPSTRRANPCSVTRASILNTSLMPLLCDTIRFILPPDEAVTCVEGIEPKVNLKLCRQRANSQDKYTKGFSLLTAAS